MPDLFAALGTLVDALDAAGIRYALAGGMALAVHAQPRATIDLDLMIAMEPDQLPALRAACERAGLVQTKRPVAKFRRIQLLRMLTIDDSTGEPISVDFLLVPGLLDEAAIGRATEVSMAGRMVRVVTAEDLVLLKLLRDSAQDRVDIQAINDAHRLDRRYLTKMATTLRVLTRLKRLI